MKSSIKQPALKAILGAKENSVTRVWGNWYTYANKTQSNSVSVFFKPTPCGNGIIQTACNDAVNKDLIKIIIERMEAILPQVTSMSAYSKIGLRGEFFDCNSIIILPSSYHRYNIEFGANVHDNTIAVFPCHDCEFSNAETEASFNAIRKNVSLLFWDRNRQPRVAIRYDNPKIQSKSTGKSLGLTTLEHAKKQAGFLWGAADGFMEIQNYKGALARITPRDGSILAEVDGVVESLSGGMDVSRWIDGFCGARVSEQ